MNPLRSLQEQGQSAWYDNIHRALIKSGELAQMIREDGLRGLTSNPTIFEKAINGSSEYDDAIAVLLDQQNGLSSRELFFTLAIEDMQAAADLLIEVYRETNGHDGFVSLEVSPDLAYDTQGTISEARQLWKRVNRPNLMIKVPATRDGLPAIEQLTSDGINVNATLLFSVERYRGVADAYLSGLESRLRRGQQLTGASVASFFVSRVDAAVDKALADRINAGREEAQPLLGQAAIANAKMAYQAYNELYSNHRFAGLNEAGATPQRLLWASTATKSPEYSDTLYIDELIGPDTVSTIPPATYRAFKEHGIVAATLETRVDDAVRCLRALTDLGIDLDGITDTLEDQGVKAFADSFNNVLVAIETKSQSMGSDIAALG